MHRHSFLARPESLTNSAQRTIRLLGVAVCAAILAGCAGTGTQSGRASNSDSLDPAWVASADDPIGILVTKRLNNKQRNHQQNTAQNNSNSSATPMLSEAMSHLGIRYRFGGRSPDTGFDCSGLVAYSAERSLGLKLPRNAAEISRWGAAIDKNELQAGDLVFFNTLGRRYSHVGIYMGNDRFIHSPSAGGVVRVENIKMAYWSKRYNGARRLDNSLVASNHTSN